MARTAQTQKVVSKRASKRRKRLVSQRNGELELSLENLKFPSYEEVRKKIKSKVGRMPLLPKSLPKGNWTPQALKVLKERYLIKNGKGEIVETPEQMCWRVAWEVASAEACWGKNRREITAAAKEFYNLLVSREFLPNSPTLMNAGTGNLLQYSACFVLPVEDSIEGIFDAIKYQALIHKSGGGTGFAFSRLRIQGSTVKTSGGVASGPVSFMRVFDAATNEIKQGGKRRGANMGILRIDHPDILEFIHCKEKGGITNFNISVAITDKFMQAYKKNKNYDLIDPKTGKKAGTLSARKVFNEIAENAWRTGDPGLVFIDRINKGPANPVPSIGPIESTNPCGEQPLYPFDSCNLGSIFLNHLVKEENGKKQMDWEKLNRIVRIATRFLDNVVEVNPFPLEQIRKNSLAIRRIGLGVGGWADLLLELGIPYNSNKALKLGQKIMKIIQEESIKVSQELAKERSSFPLWPVSIYKDSEPRRNSTVTTIAPTGTISIIAGASSGIEPLFAIAYQHIVKDESLDRTMAFVNPKFEEVAEKRGFWSEELRQKVAKHGTVGSIEEVPQDVRDVFSTAHEIHHDWHVKMQAAFQKHTENAVSKTINMESKTNVDDIKSAYLLAWKTGCKGITVFRDGCKDVQVLNLGIKDGEALDKGSVKEKIWKRPMKVLGSTYKIKTPVGTAFIVVNHDENNNPIEVFINVGKAGSDVQALAEALGRVISKSLKFGSHLTSKERAMIVVDQLKGIGGRRSVGFGSNKIRSLPDAVAVALSSHLGLKINGNNNHVADENFNEKVGADVVAEAPAQAEQVRHLADLKDPSPAPALLENIEAPGDICPFCGASALVYEEGCSKCYACGHSEC